MPPTLLAYWDTRGLAQPIRLMLHYVGEDYEEKTYSVGPGPEFNHDDWFSVKHTLGFDFPNLPYYIDGDIKISQSNAILRYLGRKYDMAGSNEVERVAVDVLCDQVMDFHWDYFNLTYPGSTGYVTEHRWSYFNLNYPSGAGFEEKRDGYLKALPKKLKPFEDLFGDKPYTVGQKLTYPDFHLYETLDIHKVLEPSCLDNFPKLQGFIERFEAIPAIKAYMESDKFIKYPINNKFAKFG